MVEANVGCLGVPFFGPCAYDPSQPYLSYFTIGELLAVVALLLAFRQLVTPKINFRLNVSGFNDRWAFWGVVAAAGSVFLAMLLPIPLTPFPPVPVLGYPIFWELMAAALILFGALRIVWIIGRPAKFTKKSAKRYFQSFLGAIGRGDSDELAGIGAELNPSLSAIFDCCTEYSEFKATEAEVKGEKYELSEAVDNAFFVLDFCSDPRFCKALVCQTPYTATSILHHICKHKLQTNMYSLVHGLVGAAFENYESILYREKRFSPLERVSNNFTRAAFADYWLLNSLQPLRAFKYWNQDHLEPWQAERYCEVLEMATLSYLDAGFFHKNSYALNGGFDVAESIAGHAVRDLNADEDESGTRPRAGWVLHNVQRGLDNIIEILIKNAERIPNYEFNEEAYDRHKDHSVYGYVAEAVFEIFCHLSRANNQRHAREYGIDLWITLFPSGESAKAVTEIRNRLVVRLKRKVEQNLDVKFPLYPALTRFLITLAGLYETKAEGNREDFTLWFHQQLKEKYAQLARDHPKEAKDMIPEDCEYDAENNILRLQKFRGDPIEFRLDPAPESASN